MGKRPGKRERLASKQAKALREQIKRDNLVIIDDSQLICNLERTKVRTNATQLGNLKRVTHRGMTSRDPDMLTKDRFGVVVQGSRVQRIPHRSELPDHRLTYKRFNNK